MVYHYVFDCEARSLWCTPCVRLERGHIECRSDYFPFRKRLVISRDIVGYQIFAEMVGACNLAKEREKNQHNAINKTPREYHRQDEETD